MHDNRVNLTLRNSATLPEKYIGAAGYLTGMFEIRRQKPRNTVRMLSAALCCNAL